MTTGSTDTSSDAPEKDQSAELLRLTIPMISRHGRSFSPLSYAVWYEYVRGANKALREEIDLLIEDTPQVNEQQTAEIYQRHLVDEMEKAVRESRAGLLSVMDSVDNTMAGATETTDQFDTKLDNLVEVMAQDPIEEDGRKQIHAFKGDLRSLKFAMRDTNRMLDASRSEISRLATELEVAQKQANFDSLSGLLNRRGLDLAIQESIQTHMKSPNIGRKPLAIIVLDIDKFKTINDTHGHLFGDKVIQKVANILDRGVMRKDFVGRLGGEEFAIILPNTDGVGATAVAERMREVVSEAGIKSSKTDGLLNFTISGGVTLYKDGETAASFIARADAAMYVAKEAGRNRISYSD